MRSTKNSLRSRTSESITDGQVHRSRIPESKKRNTRQRTTQPQTIVDFFAACAHSITDTPQPTGKRTTETVAFFELPFCDPAVHRVACTGPHARLPTLRPLAALRPAGRHRQDATRHGRETQLFPGFETRRPRPHAKITLTDISLSQ